MAKAQKNFFIEFLLINIIAFCGAGIIYAFQYLISIVKELVFYDITFSYFNLFAYFLVIVFISIIEYLLILRKDTIRKKLHIHHYLKTHVQVLTVIDTLESIFCCLLTFIIAIPLGSEGPSVYIGTMIELFFAHIFLEKKVNLSNSRYGSPMGYGLAFMNPLAGFFFYFEKKNNRGNTKQIFYQIYLLIVSFLWIVLWKYLGGTKDFYHYSLYNDDLTFFSSKALLSLIFLIPCITMPLAFVFKRFILRLSYTVKKNDKTNFYFSTIMALVTVLALKFTKNYSYMGFADEIFLSTDFFTLQDALIFLFIRYFWTIFCNDVFYLGGHVIPTFVVGAAIGEVIQAVVENFIPLTTNDKQMIIVLTALLFFSSVTMSFLTTLALSFSFGRGWVILPYLSASIALVYAISYTLRLPSLPDMMKKKSRRYQQVHKYLLYFSYAETLSPQRKEELFKFEQLKKK